MVDEKDMVDETIDADDNTVIEDAPNDTIPVVMDTTVNDLDERILASKIQTIEEYLQTVMTRQDMMLQILTELQSKLYLDLRVDPVLSDYQKALNGYLGV